MRKKINKLLHLPFKYLTVNNLEICVGILLKFHFYLKKLSFKNVNNVNFFLTSIRIEYIFIKTHDC